MSVILEFIMPYAKFFAQTYPHIWAFDTARYFVGAGSIFLIVSTLLAGKLAGRKIREDSPAWAQMRREIAVSIRTSAVFALVGGMTIVSMMWAGIEIVYSDPLHGGWVYLAFSTVALIVLHDAWFYWTHRLIHHPKLFRRMHREHHKSHNPSPWAAYSFDIFEAAINAIFLPLVLLLVSKKV